MTSETPQADPPETDRVLVLQGGGALGSYQAGVVEALQEADMTPGWVAGISIGAINAALIAGNPPERRLERLRTFWERISSGVQIGPLFPGEQARAAFNEWSAAWGATFGVPGFFLPRVPPAMFYPAGAAEALSYYDTAPLRETLLELVDFDRINRRETRLSVGAVNVRTGNFAYFDNHHDRIGPEHIMASGALPPGFPPVEIDGEFYWDGGIVSNTPLQHVLDEETVRDLTIFQVDLFCARGPLPRTIADAGEREKDIRFSSRTRLNTDAQKQVHQAKAAFRRLVDKLPPELREDPDVAFLTESSHENAVTIVQLIYRRKTYEGNAKDYEFSRRTMQEHWAAGRSDVLRSVRHRDWIARCRPEQGVAVFDLTRDARD
ncbi:patatin-like phospholipase family protein [uncultured Methylobacterium sp.]|uniref:patatin-like phospholipase family protein n=1 Tax=uncultured Methylobacterium sp. TaxID=157278 RepID=UPI00262FBD93|nr:patatin-like phospholipase family protein [uncultured Methylobacterium sp.]